MFQNPFDCIIEKIPSDLQLEVTDLQNDILKIILKENELTQFYKYLSES